MVEYLLCKEFGWTITELNEQPYNKVQRFLQIMQTRNRMEKMKGNG